MPGRVFQTIVMAAICGFAALMVVSMVIDAYVGGPARTFTNAVMEATTSDLQVGLRGPGIWLQQHL
jgi:hypothetical protein